MRKSGIVLCGGNSSRMGRAKALLPWQGRTLVETVVATLREVVREVIVVTSDAFELPRLEATVVRDREPGLGPLAGIREGLHAVGSGLAFVASTDAPHLSPSFVESMLSVERAAALDLDERPADDTLPRRLLEQAVPAGAGRGGRLTRERLSRMIRAYNLAHSWSGDGYLPKAALTDRGTDVPFVGPA